MSKKISTLPTCRITYVKFRFGDLFQNYVTSKMTSEKGFGIKYCDYVRQSCGLLRSVVYIYIQSHYVNKLRQCVFGNLITSTLRQNYVVICFRICNVIIYATRVHAGNCYFGVIWGISVAVLVLRIHLHYRHSFLVLLRSIQLQEMIPLKDSQKFSAVAVT